jgi:hypothetical protein
MVLADPAKLLLLTALPAALWLYRKRLAAGWARRFGGGSMLLRYFQPLSALTAAQMRNSGRQKTAGTLLAVATAMLALALAGPEWPGGRVHLAAAALLTVCGVTAWQVLPGAPTVPPLGPNRSVSGLPYPGSLGLEVPAPPSGAGGGVSRLPFRSPGGYDPTDRREYREGDEVRHIDWSATARAGKLITKLSPVESETNLWLLVDCSASTRAGIATPKRSLMTQLSVLIARAAASGDARFGLALFTRGLEKVIPPQVGKHQASRITLALQQWEVRSSATDIPQALGALVAHLDKRGTVFLVSDFAEPLSPEFERSAATLRERRQKLVVVRVSDPLDEELPDIGPVRIENPETGESEVVNTSDAKFRESYRAAARELQAELRRRLTRLGVPLIEMRTTDPSHRLVERMSRLRQEIRAAVSA